jgi:hypothetical protein
VPAQRCNLRTLPDPLDGERRTPPITPGRLLALLSEGQMITVIWPNGTSMLIKGKSGSRQAIAAASRRVDFLIANTTQAELLKAALGRLHRRESAKRLLTMLSLAASIPEDGQDDRHFAQRLAASELGALSGKISPGSTGGARAWPRRSAISMRPRKKRAPIGPWRSSPCPASDGRPGR